MSSYQGTARCDYCSISTVRKDQTAAEISACGELDLYSGFLLESVVEGHLAAGRRYVAVDLTRLRFIDVHGVRALQRSRDDAAGAHGALVLGGVTRRVRRVIHIAGMDDILSSATNATTRRLILASAETERAARKSSR